MKTFEKTMMKFINQFYIFLFLWITLISLQLMTFLNTLLQILEYSISKIKKITQRLQYSGSFDHYDICSTSLKTLPQIQRLLRFYPNNLIKHKMATSKRPQSPTKTPKRTQKIETNNQEQSVDIDFVDESFKDQPPIRRFLNLDPRKISNLPDQDRLKIKQQHPEMNEYFCMSSRDKTKFFHILNQQYRKGIKLAEPPGSAPKKKTIHFKKRFQIKPFRYNQKSEEITARKSFMELYKAKDENKHKRIGKFKG